MCGTGSDLVLVGYGSETLGGGGGIHKLLLQLILEEEHSPAAVAAPLSVFYGDNTIHVAMSNNGYWLAVKGCSPVMSFSWSYTRSASAPQSSVEEQPATLLVRFHVLSHPTYHQTTYRPKCYNLHPLHSFLRSP